MTEVDRAESHWVEDRLMTDSGQGRESGGGNAGEGSRDNRSGTGIESEVVLESLVEDRVMTEVDRGESRWVEDRLMTIVDREESRVEAMLVKGLETTEVQQALSRVVLQRVEDRLMSEVEADH